MDLEWRTLVHREALGNDAFLLTFDQVLDFFPGQMISLALHPRQVPRNYSLANPPGTRTQVLFNVVPGGEVTPALAEVPLGTTVGLSRAFGQFRAPETPQIWIAAGTGIAPFRSMALAGIHPQALVQGSRSPEGFYFADYWKGLDLGYVPCCSGGFLPGAYQGRLTAYLKSWEAPQEAAYLVCGSATLVVDVRDLLIQKGISYSHIRSEIYF